MILGIGILVLFVILKVSGDSAQIKLVNEGYTSPSYKKLQFIWHSSGSAIQVCLFILVLSKYVSSPELLVRYFMIAQTIYWIVFDAILNIVRGKPLFYVGKTDIIDKLLRRVSNYFKSSPELTTIIIKLIVLSITLII